MTELEAFPEEKKVERALLALAEFNGSARKAERFLKEDGIEVNRSTLQYWKDRRFAQEYERVRQEVLPRVRAIAVEEHMSLAATMRERTGELAEKLKENMDKLPPRDIAGALRNTAVAGAVSDDKAQMLSGLPYESSGGKTVDQLLMGLAGRGLQFGERRVEADGSEVQRVASIEGEK